MSLVCFLSTGVSLRYIVLCHCTKTQGIVSSSEQAVGKDLLNLLSVGSHRLFSLFYSLFFSFPCGYVLVVLIIGFSQPCTILAGGQKRSILTAVPDHKPARRPLGIILAYVARTFRYVILASCTVCLFYSKPTNEFNCDISNNCVCQVASLMSSGCDNPPRYYCLINGLASLGNDNVASQIGEASRKAENNKLEL